MAEGIRPGWLAGDGASSTPSSAAPPAPASARTAARGRGEPPAAAPKDPPKDPQKDPPKGPPEDRCAAGAGAAGPLAPGAATAALAASGPDRRPRGYRFAAVILVACTLIAALAAPHIGLDNADALYLLAVVVVAARCGRGPAIVASLVGVLAFDYFIVPPSFGFVPEDAAYVVTLVVMLAVALIVSTLAAQLRFEADVSRQRFARMKTLYDFAADLARAVDRTAVMDAVQRHLRRVDQCSRAVLLLPDRGGALRPAGASPAVALGERDLQAATAAMATDAVVDWRCARFGDIDSVHLPLRTGAANLGVLSLLQARGRFELDPERHHLEAFASQTALALERADLAVAAQQAELEAEEERMRNTLLRSVGHDLRTPLAAIQGAASALLESDALDAATKRELLQSIHDSCDRLNRQVHNLLQLTRLEAGSVHMSVEWTPLDEVVGAALTALEVRLARRRLRVDLPDDLPPLPLDGLLAQHVIMNLVDNALSHTDADSPIDIVARRDAQHVVLDVSDRGPGIPAGEEERVFDKFYRLDRSRADGGTGLGLAIARAIMHLHSGRIWVEARPGGGAAFRVAFPCTSASLPEDTAPRSEVPA